MSALAPEATVRQDEAACWYAVGEYGALDVDDVVPHYSSKARVYEYVSDRLREARRWGDDETGWITEMRPERADAGCWLFPVCAVCGANVARDAGLATHFESADEVEEYARDLDMTVHPDGAWTCEGRCTATYGRDEADRG